MSPQTSAVQGWPREARGGRKYFMGPALINLRVCGESARLILVKSNRNAFSTNNVISYLESQNYNFVMINGSNWDRERERVKEQR